MVFANAAFSLTELRMQMHELTWLLEDMGFVVEDTQIRPVGHAIPLTDEVAAQIHE